MSSLGDEDFGGYVTDRPARTVVDAGLEGQARAMITLDWQRDVTRGHADDVMGALDLAHPTSGAIGVDEVHATRGSAPDGAVRAAQHAFGNMAVVAGRCQGKSAHPSALAG